jgi:hypothetical protein
MPQRIMRLFKNKPHSTPHKKSISIIPVDNADAENFFFSLPLLIRNNDF